MRKFLSFLLLLSFFSANSQENPCPTIISGVRRTNIVSNGNGTYTADVTLRIQNDVANANPKGVRVEVLINSVVGVDTCFLASTIPGGQEYVTSKYTTATSSFISIRVTRYTASNGNCQGGICGNVLIIDQSPLPVEFASFTATRHAALVTLRWETAMEKNNTGFVIERNAGGAWEQIGWVASAALNGNSDQLLRYSFSETNRNKSITQYRVRQVDYDGQSKYTDVRAVRGEAQSGKTIVFPNPTVDGKVGILFEDTENARDITVTDMSGRIIRQIRGITSGNISIDNLHTGMYLVRILTPLTGEQVIEKVVVTKR